MTDLSPLLARPGANDLDWELPGLPGRRIILRSARPPHCTPATPILFVHHGVLRNGDDYRNHWLPLVDEADLLVIAPEFPNESFPGSATYNFGNIANGTPRTAWSFATDPTVFDLLRAQGLTTDELAGAIVAEPGRRSLIRDASVSVEVVEYRPVFVLGEVNRPGQYPYQPGMTVLSVAAVAGGFTYRAVQDQAAVVRLVNGKPVEGRADPLTVLRPGDVVTIYERLF